VNTDEKLLKAIEGINSRLDGLQADVKDLKPGQERLEKTQQEQGKKLDTVQQDTAHISTALNALPTKGDVEETVEAAKAELKADIQDAKAALMQQGKRQGRWIEAIAEKTDTPNPNIS